MNNYLSKILVALVILISMDSFARHADGQTMVLTGDDHHTTVVADMQRFSKRDVERIVELIHDHLNVSSQNPFRGELKLVIKTSRSIDVLISPPFEGVHRHRLVKGVRQWINPEAQQNPRTIPTSSTEVSKIVRNIHIDNVEACPSNIINDVITFTSRVMDFSRTPWKSIYVMPRTSYPGLSCYDKSVFLIYMDPRYYTYIYDGYYEKGINETGLWSVDTDQPNTFNEYSFDESAFYLINKFGEPGFYVVTMLHGNLKLTGRNQYYVELARDVKLPQDEIDEITQLIHEHLQIGPENPFRGTLKISKPFNRSLVVVEEVYVDLNNNNGTMSPLNPVYLERLYLKKEMGRWNIEKQKLELLSDPL